MRVPRTPIDWKHYDTCHAQGMSDTAYAKSIGLSQPRFSNRKKERHLEEGSAPTNGNLPAIPSAQPIAPQRISALPAHYDASELDELRARVATLEAFMAAIESQQRPSASAHQDAFERTDEVMVRLDTRLQAVEASTLTPREPSALPAHPSAPAHSIASERTDPPTWINRGMHIAADMADWLDAYARQKHMEKRQVVDLALRTLRALVASEGVQDA